MNIYSDSKQLSRRKRTFRIKLYFILFLILLLAASVFYLIIYSSVLKIKNIYVEDTRSLTRDEIISLVKPIVLGGKLGGLAGFENMISWPSGKMTVPDLAISDITIKKNWIQRTIEVKVNERERFAIWCVDSGQNCCWMDKEGIVFDGAPSTEGSLVSVVFDSRTGGLALGSRVEEERFTGNLISILENLSMLDLGINRIDFDNQLQELSVSTDGPTITFGLRYDSAKNIPSIPLIKNLDYKKLQYIDLTVENRIFIK